MAALPTLPLLSLEDYLNTSYDPDLEFVDGVLVESNSGNWLHSLVQSNVDFCSAAEISSSPTLLEIEGELISTADDSIPIARSEFFAE